MTAPVGVGSGSGVGAAPVRDPFPQRRGWLHAVLLSLDATFAAIERIVGVPDVVSIVFGTVQRPRLKGNCIRAFYGLQAFLGFFFLVLLVRMAILFFGR